MRATLALLLGAGLLAGAGPASAAADKSHSGDIFALRLVGGLSSLDATDNNPGVLVPQNDEDSVAGVSAALGYDWSKKGLPFRSEIEYTYRFRFDLDARIVGGANVDIENNLSTHSLMVNVFYDYDTDSAFTPYVGVGAGWARHQSDSVQVGLFNQVRESRDQATNTFAWSAQLGVLYDLGRDWKFELGYRFIHLGDVDGATFSNGAAVSAENYMSHDVTLSILYWF